MRLLCPIPSTTRVTVLTANDDGSPRSAKHFFVWNPPLLTLSGHNTNSVFYPKPPSDKKQQQVGSNPITNKRRRQEAQPASINENLLGDSDDKTSQSNPRRPEPRGPAQQNSLHRRHAADETAVLLARAISLNVRCIAFCKTRSVVEWVYERTIAALRRDDSTKHLCKRIEPYRGGYSLHDRREIEKRLFEKELVGVVATCALELGVDIGGIELTLHVGYPASISSLLQQAGRAGRGGAALEKASLSVVVCFGSPAEQHLWKKPACLLSRGISSPRSSPINAGIVQGHLLCASKEFPLTGEAPASVLRSSDPDGVGDRTLPDLELFGSREAYSEALSRLSDDKSVVQFRASLAAGGHLQAFKASAFVEKPWTRVSIRSVEPVSYSIVDLSHPAQGGVTKAVQDESAILDTLPYSRLFYHAFPGAIILHGGRKYKILSMTRPPPYDPSSAYKNTGMSLAAFAKPTNEKYMTRPLGTHTITIVKQIERVDIHRSADQDRLEEMEAAMPLTKEKEEEEESPVSVADLYSAPTDLTEGAFAGCGAVNCKRTVHGYKKLSLITRAELSRHDLSLPAMEYDTFGLWIDAEPGTTGALLGKDYGSGVHALSHALLAVAPLFIPAAGGSGTCAELWKSLFIPNGLLEAAVELLENCPSCQQDDNDLGCPACLQSGECVKFNQFLSRSAGLLIGKRMLHRLKQSVLYKKTTTAEEPSDERTAPTKDDGTPRKRARTKAMRHAKDLDSARERLFVVGRPSWPTDEDNSTGRRQENAS